MSDPKKTNPRDKSALQWRKQQRLDGKPRSLPRGRHAKRKRDDDGGDDAPRDPPPIPVHQRLGFRPAEFAALIGVSYPTVWRGIRSGKIKVIDQNGIQIIPAVSWSRRDTSPPMNHRRPRHEGPPHHQDHQAAQAGRRRDADQQNLIGKRHRRDEQRAPSGVGAHQRDGACGLRCDSRHRGVDDHRRRHAGGRGGECTMACGRMRGRHKQSTAA